MEARTAESPMDFVWENRPMDATSPFTQLHGLKRTHSAFDSPTKTAPSLQKPNNQPWFFSNIPETKSRPPVFGQPGFTTPQKVDIDFSSGPPSPASDNDEAPDTPDNNESYDRRSSLFSMFSKPSSSPGRGVSTNRKPTSKKYSHKAGQRIEKRRNRHIMKSLGLDEPEEEEEKNNQISTMGRNTARREPEPPSRSIIGDFFSYLDAHPTLPTVLSWWAQLVVNIILFSLAVSTIFAFVSAIRNEVDMAASDITADVLLTMGECGKNYQDNSCGSANVPPALYHVCKEWSKCMDQDPNKVARARVSAKTMANIINTFTDAISWKTLIMVLATILTVCIGSNWSFQAFRTRHEDRHQQHYQDGYYRQGPHNSQQPHQPQHHDYRDMFSQNYQPQTPSYESKTTKYDRRGADRRNQYVEDTPESPERLLLTDGPSNFVTGRSRDREAHLSSPSKRRFA